MSQRNFFRGLKNEKENMKKKPRKSLKWMDLSKRNLRDKNENLKDEEKGGLDER
jgi:hypothetical protein